MFYINLNKLIGNFKLCFRQQSVGKSVYIAQLIVIDITIVSNLLKT